MKYHQALGYHYVAARGAIGDDLLSHKAAEGWFVNASSR